MESGNRVWIRMMIGAVLAGLLALLPHPLYRNTFRAWVAGAPDEAPILRSNEIREGGTWVSSGGLSDRSAARAQRGMDRGGLSCAGPVSGGGDRALAPASFARLSSPFLLAAACLELAAWAGRAVSRRGWARFGGREFRNVPEKPALFVAAQFAIQLGRMISLSAWDFTRWAVGGAVANLLAIPRIGIVFQLAILAGWIGLIPGVGSWWTADSRTDA